MPDDDRLTVRPAGERAPAHPSVTPEQISQLVERFYGSVRHDARLAPIFAKHMPEAWGPHLDKIKAFWRSVLLKTAEYDGRPVPAHAKMAPLEKEDFIAWLNLFRTIVAEIFEPDAQPLVIETAERIASSLWLATNGDLLAKPPHWSPD